jgi:teichuronic acid exporter
LGEQVTIRDKVLASVPWALLETASSAALGVISVLVLSRLLPPTEFGVAALALAFGQYGDLIIDSLLTGAVIQRPQLSERALDTAFWMSIALGSAAALGCWSASGPIAQFYERRELAGYVAALGISALLTGASLVPRALLARQLSLRSLAVRALASRLLAVAATIALAIAGYGAWAIIAGTLVSGLSTAILSWTAGIRRPRLQFSPAACQEFLSFGWPIAGQELLWSAVNRIFPLLVGLLHGADAVGYLNFATKLVEPVAGILGASAYRLGLPMFSALQGDRPALQRAFRSASRYSFALVAPALVGLAAVAPDLIPLLFGRVWRPAIPVVEIVALYNAVLFMRAFVPPCIIALGAPHRNLVTAIVTACAVIAGAFATEHVGITIVALVWSARLALSLPVSIHQMSKMARLTAAEQFQPFLGPSLACAGMFLIVQIARHFVAGLGLLSFAVTLAAGIAAYLLLMSLFDRSLFTQALTLARFGSGVGRNVRAI